MVDGQVLAYAGDGQVLAYTGVLSVQFIFSAYQVMTKIAYERYGIDPLALAVYRFGGSAFLLLILGAYFFPQARMWPRRGHFCRFLLMALCMVGNVLGVIFALTFTSNAMVAILQILRPVFASLLGFVHGTEEFSWSKLAAMLLCMQGACTVVLGGAGSTSDAEYPLLGALCTCVHSFSIAFYVTQQSVLVDAGYSAWAINGQSYLMAFFMTLVVMKLPIARDLPHGVWISSEHFFALILAHSVFLVAIYSYIVMAWSVKQIGGTAVMLAMLLQCTITMALGWYILGEVVHQMQAFGCLMIIGGFLGFVLSSKKSDEKLPILLRDKLPSSPTVEGIS